MRKWIYLVPFWSVPGRSTLHYYFLQLGMSTHFLQLISKTLQYTHVKVTKTLMRGFQNGSWYVSSITGSQDMHF